MLEYLSADDFQWLDLDYGLTEFPYAVLGFLLDSRWLWRPKFKPGRTWLNISHQTRGVCDGQQYLVGTVLSPTAKMRTAMTEIAQRWHGTNLGCHGLGPTLDDVVAYRQQLNVLLDEDCNESFQHLEEAMYPIDIGPATLANVCSDVFPADLRETFEPDIRTTEWRIYILAVN